MIGPVETLGVVIVYLVVVTGVGSAVARRASTSSDWAVAGGGMSAVMLVAGIAGTRIGGAGTYGVAERAVSGGLWYMWWYSITTFLAIAIVGLFFVAVYRRLKLATVGQIFSERFGRSRCQALTSLCVQTEYAIVNVIEAYLIGVILASLTGIPMGVTVFFGAAILVSYISIGGLWGSAAANLIHCATILVGLLAVIVLGTAELGGVDALLASVERAVEGSGRAPERWWSPVGAGWLAVIGMFFSAAIHTPAASVYTNFATAARSERMLIPAFLAAGAVASLMPLLAGGVGIVTVGHYGIEQGLRGYHNLTRLAMDLDPLIGGVALAAVLAAVISSGGPILLSSSTMFVNDWLARGRDVPAEQRLRWYRVTTLVYGTLAALVAWLLSHTTVSLLDLLLFGFAMVVPPAVAVGYLIYWPRTSERACYQGLAAGYIGGLIWFALCKWAVASGLGSAVADNAAESVVFFLFATQGQGVDPSYVTTLIPLALIPVLSLREAGPDARGREFYARIARQ